MEFIKPTEINDGNMTSTTLEPDPAQGEVLWVAGEYQKDDEVIKTNTHRRYRAVDVTSDDPELGVALVPPTWVDIGPTNKYAQFSDYVHEKTKFNGDQVITLTFSQITNGVAFFGLSGVSSIRVKMTVAGDGVVFDKQIDMRDYTDVVDYYEYFFSPIIERDTVVTLGLPAYLNGEIEITMGSSGDAQAGKVVIGKSIIIGRAVHGTSQSLKDYSIKTTDQFGRFNVVRRNTSKNIDYRVLIPRNRAGYVFKELSAITTTPCVWIGGDESDDATITYGFYQDYQNNIAYPTLTDATLIIEGLV